MSYRLNTAAQRAEYRKLSIPQGATPDDRNSEAGEVYRYERLGKLYAIAFAGKAGKPAWHYSFRDAQRRDASIAEFFDGIAKSSAYKAERKQAKASFQHTLTVGSILRSSWGYDQTNIDYYEVTALIGSRMVEVREICQETEETEFMQGKCVPVPGMWATEPYYDEAYKAQHGCYPRRDKAPMRCVVQEGNRIKVSSCASAYPCEPVATVAGKPVFRADHWTAYA